jgi:hypothetical protein
MLTVKETSKRSVFRLQIARTSTEDIYKSIPSVEGEPKESRESGEMKNKRKYNQNSKAELPKRYRKNKK